MEDASCVFVCPEATTNSGVMSRALAGLNAADATAIPTTTPHLTSHGISPSWREGRPVFMKVIPPET
jgi:hypothetical protein